MDWSANTSRILARLGFGASREAPSGQDRAIRWSPEDGEALSAQPQQGLHLLSLGWRGEGMSPAETMASASLRAGSGACWIDASGSGAAGDRLERLGEMTLGRGRVVRARAGEARHTGPKIFGIVPAGSGAAVEIALASLQCALTMDLVSLASCAFMGAASRAAKNEARPNLRGLIESLALPSLVEQAADVSLSAQARAAATHYLKGMDGRLQAEHGRMEAMLSAPFKNMLAELGDSLSETPARSVAWSSACRAPTDKEKAGLIIVELPKTLDPSRSKALSLFLAQVARDSAYSNRMLTEQVEAALAGAPGAKAAIVVKSGSLPFGWGTPPCSGKAMARFAIEDADARSFSRSFSPARAAQGAAAEFAARALWAFDDSALADAERFSGERGWDERSSPGRFARMLSESERAAFQNELASPPERSRVESGRI